LSNRYYLKEYTWKSAEEVKIARFSGSMAAAYAIVNASWCCREIIMLEKQL